MRVLIDADVIDGKRIYTDTNGYQRLGKNIYLHRYIVEKALGRKLKGKECVHHLDHNRSNNNRDNLVICPNASYHQLIHAKERIVRMGGDPTLHHYCNYHRELHDKTEFSFNKTWSGLHNYCRNGTNEYRKKMGLNRNKFGWRARMNQQYRRVFKKYTNRDICKINPEEETL